MKKAHIALVGGQPVPVYIGIKDDGQANDVVLICSADSRIEVERIKAHFPKRNITIEECSPVAIPEIEALAKRLNSKFADYETTLNLTSGTKLWALTFFRVFNETEYARFIYVDQNNVITDIVRNDSHNGKIDTLTRIALYGTPLTDYRTFEEYTDEDFHVLDQLQTLRKVNKWDFLLLTSCNADNRLSVDENLYRETQGGSSLELSDDGGWAKLKIIGTYNTKEYELESEHLEDILFNFGWFELKVARELKKNPHIKNVWLNCEFNDTEGNPKNEIDIIAEFGDRLLFVECKTMIHDTTDIDKFRSAFRNFSGTSTTGLFVTNDAPNPNSQERYDHAIEKCRDNGIFTYNFAKDKGKSLSDIINTRLSAQNKR